MNLNHVQMIKQNAELYKSPDKPQHQSYSNIVIPFSIQILNSFKNKRRDKMLKWKIKISTIEEKKTIEDELTSQLKNMGYEWFTCEGVSITSETNLFERFQSDLITLNTIIKLFEQDFYHALNRFEELIVNEGIYTQNHYEFVDKIMSKGIKYNIIVHTDNCSKFIWIKLNEARYDVFNSCKELADMMYQLTGKKEQKHFYYSSKLKCIDKCLRNYGVPYPGNFDGIIYNKDTLDPVMVIEFSKVKWKNSLEEHLNSYCSDNSRFWKEDKNRWNVLFKLKLKLNIPVYIVWWLTKSFECAIGELQMIDEKSCRNSITIHKLEIQLKDLSETLFKLIK